MKIIEKIISKAALATAKKATDNASAWLVYQPKEPVSLKNLKKEKDRLSRIYG